MAATSMKIRNQWIEDLGLFHAAALATIKDLIAAHGETDHKGRVWAHIRIRDLIDASPTINFESVAQKTIKALVEKGYLDVKDEGAGPRRVRRFALTEKGKAA